MVDYLRQAARLLEEVHQAHLLTVDHLQVAVHLQVAAHPNHLLDQDLGQYHPVVVRQYLLEVVLLHLQIR